MVLSGRNMSKMIGNEGFCGGRLAAQGVGRGEVPGGAGTVIIT